MSPQNSFKMLEPVRYTNIGDICVTDLIFYHREIEDKLIRYCHEYSISYMPDKDRKSCWKLTGETFERLEEVPKEFICSPTDLIFDTRTINKFAKSNPDEVMFVVENGLIKGIVHIVDYNNPNLYVELYRMLLKFEHNLRMLLIRKDFRNEDVIGWFKEKTEEFEGKEADNFHRMRYESHSDKKAIERRKNSNPLQTFYLRDLINFSVDKEIFTKNEVNPYDIGNLRNWIAHSKDVTSTNLEDEHAVYNMEGLREFVKLVKSFFKSYDKLEIKLEETEKPSIF